MCTDAAGTHHAAGIPPPLIRADVIARVKADAELLLPPQIAEIFGRTTPFFQPIFDLESPRLVFGRVVLSGDAAFVARPHVGAGATKAALDAADARRLPARRRRGPRPRSGALRGGAAEIRQRHGRRWRASKALICRHS